MILYAYSIRVPRQHRADAIKMFPALSQLPIRVLTGKQLPCIRLATEADRHVAAEYSTRRRTILAGRNESS